MDFWWLVCFIQHIVGFMEFKLFWEIYTWINLSHGEGISGARIAYIVTQKYIKNKYLILVPLTIQLMYRADTVKFIYHYIHQQVCFPRYILQRLDTLIVYHLNCHSAINHSLCKLSLINNKDWIILQLQRDFIFNNGEESILFYINIPLAKCVLRSYQASIE